MSGCTDKRFQGLLHAYELGMLTDDERRELELHILDCDSCRENVRQFQASVRLIKRDRDIRDTISDLAKSPVAVSEQTPAPRRPQWRRLLPSLGPAAITAAIIIFLLVLKPWQIEIKPTQEATAGHNRLAIMYFDNVVEPSDSHRLGEILTNLLITDIAESRYIQVVSSQRLFDILKLLGREGAKIVDRETATQVARRADAEWMLMGSILQVEPQLVLTAQLVDVRTGNAIASQRIMGGQNENIFSVVDQLSAAVRQDLALPTAARQETDRPVAEFTTHSPEAYRRFIEGKDNAEKFYLREAEEDLLEAVSIDSTFAMAYYVLAYHIDTSYIHKAVQFAGKASQREQYFIHSLEAFLQGDFDGATERLKELLARYPDEKEAWFRLGNYYFGRFHYNDALSCFRKVIDIDPLSSVTRSMLAYTYSRMNLIDKALAAIDSCIALFPDEANPYDSKGDILAEHGQFEEAERAYLRAVRVKPDFSASLLKLGHLYLLSGDYTMAQQYYDRIYAIAGDSTHARPGFYDTYIPLRQGKFNDALKILDRIIARDTTSMVSTSAATASRLKSFILATTGRCAPAITEVEIYMAPAMSAAKWNSDLRLRAMMAVTVYAECGEFQRAELAAEKLRIMATTDYPREAYYEFAKGIIELKQGNVDAAISYLERAVVGKTYSFCEHYILAQAYMAARRFREAAAEYEGLLSTFSENQHFLAVWSVKTYYNLGLACEELGWPDKAISWYEKFLDTWKQADPGINEIADAKDRLARLKNRS